jgi:pyruvate,water dikinase
VALSEAVNLAECGGKAASLAAVARLGIPVPDGFVIPNSVFRSFLRLNGLDSRIAELQIALRPGDPAGAIRASAHIRELILSASLPPVLPGAFESIWRELGGGPLAVRSSAVGEDSAAASFAGQLDTVLNVDTPADLHQAVLECWASYWSARCLSYQHVVGIALVGMGVIVQRMIHSRVSGVLFTVAPAGTASANDMLVEYCYGLGEQLVGGDVNPGAVYMDRVTANYSCVRTPEQEENEHAERLIHLALPRLREFGLLLESHLAGPLDVEWAVDHSGTLSILQSRPITVRLERRPVLLSNANIGENYPKPVSPFLYSLASTAFYHYFRNLGAALGIRRARLDAAELPLRNIVCAPGSRLYYNLTSIYQCLEAIPFGRRFVKLFNEFVGCGSPASGGCSQPTTSLAHLRTLSQVTVMLFRALYLYLTLSFRISRFEAATDAFDRDCSHTPWKAKPFRELNADLNRFLAIRFHRWTDASLADAAAMVTTGLLKAALARWYSGGDPNAASVALLQGLQVVSVQPAMKLWEIAKWIRNDPELFCIFRQRSPHELKDELYWNASCSACRNRIEEYVREWGFRCCGELMLTEPNFEDDLTPLLELLKSYVIISPAIDPFRQSKVQSAERRAAYQRLLTNVRGFRPGKTAILRILLSSAERSVALRERARLKQALLYSRCRRILLTAGERLVATGKLKSREDIFLFTYPEVDEILAGRYLFEISLYSIAACRREDHEAISRRQFPDTFTYVEGAAQGGCPSTPATVCSAEVGDTPILHGITASGGRFQGRAAVLTDLSQADRLAPGDILVTRQTDPGWGALLLLCKGLVIERGGMLSHGAIIAREFGIPAVIGIPHATEQIAHHQTITVDGYAGLVYVGEP